MGVGSSRDRRRLRLPIRITRAPVFCLAERLSESVAVTVDYLTDALDDFTSGETDRAIFQSAKDELARQRGILDLPGREPPVRDFSNHRELRQDRMAETRGGQVLHRSDGIQFDRDTKLQPMSGRRVLQHLTKTALGAWEHEVHRLQLVETDEWFEPVTIVLRTDQAEGLVDQLLDLQTAKVYPLIKDGDIDYPVADPIDRLVAESLNSFQVNVRILPTEDGIKLWKQTVSNARRERKQNNAGWNLRSGSNAVPKGRDFIQNPARLSRKSASSRCSTHAASCPDEERHADLPLKIANLAAERGLGHAEGRSRPRNALQFHGLHEVTEVVDFHPTSRRITAVAREFHVAVVALAA
jgi:hypothetical protein